jgi:hypothetical protein
MSIAPDFAQRSGNDSMHIHFVVAAQDERNACANGIVKCEIFSWYLLAEHSQCPSAGVQIELVLVHGRSGQKGYALELSGVLVLGDEQTITASSIVAKVTHRGERMPDGEIETSICW